MDKKQNWYNWESVKVECYKRVIITISEIRNYDLWRSAVGRKDHWKLIVG